VRSITLPPGPFTTPFHARLIEKAAEVARTARLRAYDAVYAALALDRSAALMMLDVDLRSKVSLAFPHLRLQ